MAEWDPTAPTSPPDRPLKARSPAPPALPPLPARSKTRSRPPPAPLSIHPSKEDEDPQFRPGTYVVQIPKEQILRVPPTENAQLAEEYLRKMHHRKRMCSSCFGGFVCLLLSILLIIVFILGLAILIFFLVVRPGIPSFSVESLIAKKVNNKSRAEFNLKIGSHNPSLKMEYCYEAGGNVTLSHKGEDIAAGKTPGFCQASASSSTFKLEIEGSRTNFPKETYSLLLLIQFPVRLKIWGMQVLSRSLDVTCDARLSGLATTNKTRNVVSQGCRAKLH